MSAISKRYPQGVALLKSEQNGVEFYTVEATGESGISQSGLAKLCGVSRQTIIKLEKTLVTFEAPDHLKAFVDEALTLVTSEDAAVTDGQEAGNLRIYRAKFCIAVIKHYADKGRKEAVYSLMKFAEMGFNAWVQSVTGWQASTDVAEIKEAVQKLADLQSQSSLSPQSSTPNTRLFNEAEIRKWNQREMYWSTVPGTASYENCESVGRIYGVRSWGRAEPNKSQFTSLDGVLEQCRSRLKGEKS